MTIPDGSTIIVGGLNRSNVTQNIQRVPILGELPILEYLFSSRRTSTADSTLFIFIRPVVLKDDPFRDLKFLSARDLRAARLPGDLPVSKPLTME